MTHNENKHSNNLPPVIRVFLSSTFADMENERTYFNEVIVPRLHRICSDRGVSFFSVDLRWGITEDDQLGGQVLPICLSEIDRCRPYFIGILGNRYGSLMADVPHQISDTIPWLEGKEGKSITELEMLYAVLDHEREDNAPYSSFYFRSDELTDKWYGHTEQDEKLKELKKRIKNDPDVHSSSYNSVEEFGEKVMHDILAWCDKEFPVPERVQEVRRKWYNGELLRNYLPIEENHAFLDAYCTESHRSLMLHGVGEIGKTTLLTAWEPKDGDKILINCGSDDEFRYWPAIVNTIIYQLGKKGGANATPDKPLRSALVRGMMNSLFSGNDEAGANKFYFTSPRDMEEFRTAFLSWVGSLNALKPIYVVINDLNLLDDDDTQMLSWIPAQTSGNIRFICSTNKPDMTELAEIIGWNCKEMPAFDMKKASKYITDYLNIYGKSLSASQQKDMLASKITESPGYLRSVCDFLINHGRFHNLDKLISDISSITSETELYTYLYSYMIGEAGEAVATIADYVLAMLIHSPLSMTESECHKIASESISFTALEWSSARNILEQFRVIKGDYWNVTDDELKDVVKDRLSHEKHTEICEKLGDYYSALLKNESTEDCGSNSIYADKRQITAYAKAILKLYAMAGNNDKLLLALSDHDILLKLYKMEYNAIRAGWMHIALTDDRNVETELFKVFQGVHKNRGSKDGLTVALANMFVDMECVGVISDVNEMMAGVSFYGTLHEDADGFSDEFSVLMSKLLHIYNTESLREFYTCVCKVLDRGLKLNLSETALLLFHKSNCENSLKLTSELLMTANLYFETALKSGKQFEFHRAMSMLASAHRISGNNHEAIKLHKKLISIHEASGNLADYISEHNSLGMAFYGADQHDDAISTLKKAQDLWLKKGDSNNAYVARLNICNAYSVSGDTETALRLATEAYEDLKAKNDPKLEKMIVMFRGNMGHFASTLKRYHEAEVYLLDALELAEENNLESSFLIDANRLSEIYLNTGSYMKGFELEERIMEMHWMRKEYSEVISALNRACNFLRFCNHTRQIKGFREKWRQRFSTIEGGEKYFNENATDSVYDSREIDRLREDLAMAKSAGQIEGICEAMKNLAEALFNSDYDEYWQTAIGVANLFRENGLGEKLEEYVHDMLIHCFKHGKPKTEEALNAILSYTKNDDTREIARIWSELGEYDEKKRDEEKPDIENLLNASLSLAEKYQRVVFFCWYDLSETIVNNASSETVIKLVRALSDGRDNLLIMRFESKYIMKLQEDLELLKSDYFSFIATEILEHYERAIEFLDTFDCDNVGTVSGNIALIFRRRKDQEKTLHYHKVSMNAYKRKNIIYDCLIEQMNLATAYKAFNRPLEAIETLREGLATAQREGVRALEGAIAGNLAATLRDNGTPEDHDEIMRCFELEERYFRSENLTRDLVISLINQLAYHLQRGEISDHLEQLEEAGMLIRKYKFVDFYQALAYMENVVKTNKGSDRSSDEQSPESFITEILGDAYTVGRIFKEDGRYHADCLPKEEIPQFKKQLRLIFDPAVDNKITFIGAYLPMQYSNEARENVQAYLDWNNESLTYYNMVMMDNFQVQGGHNIVAADREDLKKRLEFYISLWDIDCMNLTLLSVGFPDIDTCKGLKLKAISTFDEDDDQ